jgi:hypothetical protein
MPICPTCGREYPDEHDGCPHCAADAPVVKCERCGERYRGADACPACGAARETLACAEHPDREAAGRCVVCGRAVCDECRVDDRYAFLCREHEGVMVIEGWAQVYSAPNEFEAQLLRENLRAEGIDAQIYSQRDTSFSVDLGELSIVRLLVPVWEYEHALHVIREHMAAEGDVAFACPSCGEAYEPGARECTGCGAALDADADAG